MDDRHITQNIHSLFKDNKHKKNDNNHKNNENNDKTGNEVEEDDDVTLLTSKSEHDLDFIKTKKNKSTDIDVGLDDKRLINDIHSLLQENKHKKKDKKNKNDDDDEDDEDEDDEDDEDEDEDNEKNKINNKNVSETGIKKNINKSGDLYGQLFDEVLPTLNNASIPNMGQSSSMPQYAMAPQVTQQFNSNYSMMTPQNQTAMPSYPGMAQYGTPGNFGNPGMTPFMNQPSYPEMTQSPYMGNNSIGDLYGMQEEMQPHNTNETNTGIQNSAPENLALMVPTGNTINMPAINNMGSITGQGMPDQNMNMSAMNNMGSMTGQGMPAQNTPIMSNIGSAGGVPNQNMDMSAMSNIGSAGGVPNQNMNMSAMNNIGSAMGGANQNMNQMQIGGNKKNKKYRLVKMI